MLELLEDVGLALEARQRLFVACQRRRHELDRHERPGLGVLRAVHRPHCTAAERLVDHERTKLLADEHVRLPGRLRRPQWTAFLTRRLLLIPRRGYYQSPGLRAKRATLGISRA